MTSAGLVSEAQESASERRFGPGCGDGRGGGWLVNGRSPFASGYQYADW
jgi:hypothetical protein